MSTQLTARVSVRVQAKNTSQSNSQKRDTGKNIANALGNGNISDELADQIGNTSSPTIADENGNEWVKMEDVIAAGRKMKENGAFDEKTIYHPANNDYYQMNVLYPGPCQIIYRDRSNDDSSVIVSDDIIDVPAGCVVIPWGSPQPSEEYPDDYIVTIQVVSLESFTLQRHYRNYDGSDSDRDSTYTPNARTTRVNLGDGVTSYSFFTYSLGIGAYAHVDPSVKFGYIQPFNSHTDPVNMTIRYMSSDDRIAAVLFGTKETTGGSIIDWDKPDDEVEEDIRRLHETWDVSEHPGASGQGVGAGTYILAGPIEFNDADPTQGPPGSVG